MGKYEKLQKNTSITECFAATSTFAQYRFEISDISKCFENFVSQTLGVLTRIYAAGLRYLSKV